MPPSLSIDNVRGNVDFAIITILPAEFKAILKRFSLLKPHSVRNRSYQYCRIMTPAAREFGVAIVRSLEQGPSAAQSVAQHVIDDLNPGSLILAGIAGGVPSDEFSLGDVLLANRLHVFSVYAALQGGLVQYQQTGGPMHRHVQPFLAEMIALKGELSDWNSDQSIGCKKPTVEVDEHPNALSLYGDSDWQRQVRGSLAKHFPDDRPARPPLFHVGPCASGNVLVKDPDFLRQWLASARHLTHVEMEASGVYEAAFNADVPFLSVRGISDIVGFPRNDDWTTYACAAAAALVDALIRSGLLQRILPPPPPPPPRADLTRITRAINVLLEADDLYRPPSSSLPAYARYITPHISWNDERRPPRTSLEHLIRRRSQGKPVAIVSPPGAGKSLALTRLKDAIEMSDSHSPLLLFINLGLLDATRFQKWPWDIVRSRLCVKRDRTSAPEESSDALKRHAEEGSACFLLDGLDEYGVGHMSHVKDLVARCVHLAAKGVRVTVTCRAWFWEHRVPRSARDRFDVLEIHEFDQGQALQMLGNQTPRLPPDAFEDPEQRTTLKKWMLNPKLLSFLRDSGFHFKTKTDVFRNWARHVVESEKRIASTRKLDLDETLHFFGDLAVLAASARTRELRPEYWKPPEFNKGPYLPKHKQHLKPKEAFSFTLMARQARGASARFSHALVWEYFVAARLASEFSSVITAAKAMDLSALNLSNTSLDFVPASVDGFLLETLGDSYEDRLHNFLRKPVEYLGQLPCDLLRNLVEYIGMTSRGENPALIRTLLRLIETSSLDTLVRYNAARAMERIHPGAPRPYFDLSSDWGGEDWKDEQKWRFDEAVWTPWAIRGAHKETRQPGTFPAMDIDMAKAREADADLQGEVSTRLMRVLEKSNAANLRINCSHALVRWYDFRDYALDRRLEKLIKRTRQKHTRENLAFWVKKAAWRLRETWP